MGKNRASIMLLSAVQLLETINKVRWLEFILKMDTLRVF